MTTDALVTSTISGWSPHACPRLPEAIIGRHPERGGQLGHRSSSRAIDGWATRRSSVV